MSQASLTKIEKTAASLRQQVIERLRESVISGHLSPGQRLTERELTESLGVSRTVVREALRQLEAEGLIEVIPNKGPVVRTLTAEEAEDIYRIRAVLQGLAAQQFIANADEQQLAALEDALSAVVAAYDSGNAEQTVETKTHFYDVLNDGAASETLSSMLATLHARMWRWRALGLAHPQRSSARSSESLDNLRDIVAAIKNRDAEEAERITREEASQAAEEVLRLLAYTDKAAWQAGTSTKEIRV
ncbi:MAG: GntR family transcriptional regulator [Gammaproteobacteria bacterium]|nr:GntR family transcriptional regulator [Gammaproteobacteria bacterium]